MADNDEKIKRTIPDDFMPTDNLKVVFVHFIGRTGDGDNIYHLFISDDCENTWAEGWWEKPAANVALEHLIPEEEHYQYVRELVTDITLDLAQRNSCFTMQDCRDHVIALAAENLDEAEEYPDEGRIVIQFGELLDDVEALLAKRNMFTKWV